MNFNYESHDSIVNGFALDDFSMLGREEETKGNEIKARMQGSSRYSALEMSALKKHKSRINNKGTYKESTLRMSTCHLQLYHEVS